MKRVFCTLLMLALLITTFGSINFPAVFAEEYEMELPLMSDLVDRPADKEELLEDGSWRVVYDNVEDFEFEVFITYMPTFEIAGEDWDDDGNVIMYLANEDTIITLNYNMYNMTCEIVYPAGTYKSTLIDTKPAMKFAEGDIVTFGSFEQNNNESDGTEPIEWIVLDIDGNKALLLSKYGLASLPYNTKAVNGWWNCFVRSWLNDSFIDTAFTNEERDAILLTEVDNSRSQNHPAWGSGELNTKDYIFLLSWWESFKYVGAMYTISRLEARTSPTEYAKKVLRAYTSSSNETAEGKGACKWWLRSPGHLSYEGAYIDSNGTINCTTCDEDDICVRPALWVNVEALSK